MTESRRNNNNNNELYWIGLLLMGNIYFCFFLDPNENSLCALVVVANKNILFKTNKMEQCQMEILIIILIIIVIIEWMAKIIQCY